MLWGAPAVFQHLLYRRPAPVPSSIIAPGKVLITLRRHVDPLTSFDTLSNRRTARAYSLLLSETNGFETRDFNDVGLQ